MAVEVASRYPRTKTWLPNWWIPSHVPYFDSEGRNLEEWLGKDCLTGRFPFPTLASGVRSLEVWPGRQTLTAWRGHLPLCLQSSLARNLKVWPEQCLTGGPDWRNLFLAALSFKVKFLEAWVNKALQLSMALCDKCYVSKGYCSLSLGLFLTYSVPAVFGRLLKCGGSCSCCYSHQDTAVVMLQACSALFYHSLCCECLVLKVDTVTQQPPSISLLCSLSSGT